jgi:hypothetical protein
MEIAFMLGRNKFCYVNEIEFISHFCKRLDNPVTQCFASIRVSNYSWASSEGAT